MRISRRGEVERCGEGLGDVLGAGAGVVPWS